MADTDITQADKQITEPFNSWCCMHHVLSLPDNFSNEKLLLQHYLNSCGHVCLFLLKFHCELNPIEMLWDYAKYHKLFQLLFHCFINLQAH